jgi:hypothetical protein
MNDRILMLAKKCYTTKWNPFGSDEELFDTEKFANLLLQDVYDILSSYHGKVEFIDLEHPEIHPITRLKTHFGNKE